MTDLAEVPTEDGCACGAALAALLAGAWRRSPPPLRPATTLAAILAPLIHGGAGGLAWHRLRQTPLHTTPTVRELRQHYRLQTLQAADREAALVELIARLRAAGVEPLVIKGWSSARLYPELGLRPSADIDLCVPAEQLESAAVALSAAPLPCAVDLHGDVPDLDRPWHEIVRRSRLAALGATAVRVLGPEDQLRLLCLHLVRHGMGRPLWLCDVGACLESLPATFNWDYCLAGAPHLSEWTACVLDLAERLLDARPNGSPAPRPVRGAAPWIERAVLWCWGTESGRSLRYYLRRPREAVRRLRYHGIHPHHGSTPIKAAFHLGLGPRRRLPLLLVQLAGFARRKVPHVAQRLLCPRRRVALPFTIHHH